MKEIFSMWKYPRMMLLFVLATLSYAFLLVPFKGFQWIPGVAEIRPAAALPPVLGIVFGPAGAWGSALGNALGDYLGGTLTMGSLFGALGNFCFAMVAYKAWFWVAGDGFRLGSGADWLRYVSAAILSSASVAFVIAWGVETLQLSAFATIGSIILINNVAATLLIGPFLLKLLLNRFQAWNLYWKSIMRQEDISAGLAPVSSRRLLWTGAVGGLMAGILISHLLYGNAFFDAEIMIMDPAVSMLTLPFLILFFLGLLLA